MITTEQIKEQYFIRTSKLLCDCPDVLRTFKQLWQDGKLREAYLCADEAIQKAGIVLSAEERKADEGLYWDVVN